MVQSVEWGVDRERIGSFTRPTSTIERDFPDLAASLPGRFFAVNWDGFWYVPETLEVRVHADGGDAVAVTIDDDILLNRRARGAPTTSERIPIDAGLHRLREYTLQRGESNYLNVQWAPAGGRPRPFDPEHLFPARPDPEQIAINQRLLMLRRLVAAVWIVPLLIYLFRIGLPVVTTTARLGRARLPGMAQRAWGVYTSIASGRSRDSIPGTRARHGTGMVVGVLGTVLLFGLPLFIGLGSTDLYNDEAIYSYAVDRMLETGEWLTPESSPQTAFAGDPGERRAPFFEKPPLKFWIVALPIKLGMLPHDEFGLRFWDAVFGAVAFAYVFLIGRRLVDPLCGAAAVFLLFIHPPLLHGHGLRSNVMEAALVLSYVGGMYHFLAWSASDLPSRRRLHIFSVAGYFTLGFMTKFVVAAFLPIVVGATALCFRDWRRLLFVDARSWAVAAGAAIILIAPWFTYEYTIYGPLFWDTIFGSHVYDRMRGALAADHTQPWSYYYSELHVQLSRTGVLVWVLAGAALWALESARRRWKAGVLILAWFLVPVGIFSMSVTQIYHYSFPFLPPVALMGAYAASLVVRVARRLYTDSARKGRVPRSSWLRPARYALAALAAAVLFFAWPFDQYAVTLESLGRERRPVSALRACLVDQFDTLRATSQDTVSRFYMHLPRGAGLTHNYYYYFRVFDRWEHLASPSDADLFARLFVPSHHAVAFVPTDEYGAFLQRLDNPELREALVTELEDPRLAAGHVANVERDSSPTAVQIGSDGMSGGLLVLPGSLSACADVVSRAGGVLVRNR